MKEGTVLKVLYLVTLAAVISCSNPASEAVQLATFCNPLDLSYRFMPIAPSRREAADPSVIRFKDRYYLFASKSGGYWSSADLVEWELIETDQIPTEEYAPTAIVLRDTVFFLASSKTKSTIYKSADPLSGEFQIAKDSLEVAVWDPAFFQDDDGQLYLYWGCSNVEPLYGVKIDDQNFEFQGDIQKVILPNPNRLGWEVRGDYNTRKDVAPWLEGPWMTKHKGKYYLQYAAPGTLEKSYADGVYVSDQPLGDFELQAHNPFALKPEGFICGAGHGSTFQDEYQNLWHAGTMVISVKEKFERRLGLFATFFDGDDVLFSSTRFGDYPMAVPFGKVKDPNELFTGWMLLSYQKPVTSSSTLSEYPQRHINDENVRSIWSAKTGDASEWVAIDLEQESLIHAIQVNFAEVNSKLLKRPDNSFHAYTVEGSLDGQDWFMIANLSENRDDRTHQYLTFDPVKARHVKVNNVSVPDGNFAMMGLRVFGIAEGKKPKLADEIIGKRSQQDPRDLALSWSSVPNATGYNIRYGIDPEKLYRNHLVYDSSAITIRSLDSKQDYYFAIEAFNESGVGELSQTSGPF